MFLFTCKHSQCVEAFHALLGCRGARIQEGNNRVSRDNTAYQFSLAYGELRKSAITLHRQRYQEIDFMPRDFQDPYEKNSVYFVARREEQVVGVCRLVIQDLRTLPTYAHFELFEHERRALIQFELGTYAELGALTKLPQYPDLVPGLLATTLVHASDLGMSHLLCCTDRRLFESARMFLDTPYKVIGNARVFYGSVKIPCVLSIPETLERLKARKPQILQHLPPRHRDPEDVYLPGEAA